MKWLLLAFMVQLEPNMEDIFVFNNPSFESKADCLKFVETSQHLLLNFLAKEFDGRPPVAYVCTTPDGVREIMELAKQNERGV